MGQDYCINAYHGKITFMQALNLFRLIDRISTLLRAEERKKYTAVGLQPIHGQILEYLAACNKYSDTPAAVTEYFGLTKGTVSQSVQVLERKGYIVKTQDRMDKRVQHLDLSTQGQELLAQMRSVDVFLKAEAALIGKPFGSFEEALKNALTELQKANHSKSFGICHTCVYFAEIDQHFNCQLTSLPLMQHEVTQICREHVLLEAVN